MTIKSQGGIFGRNPTFNNVEADGDISTQGSITTNSGEFFTLSSDNLAVGSKASNHVGIAFGSPNILPTLDGAYSDGGADLGSSSYAFGNIYLKNNVILASGSGIDFSATSGTGTSELFNDYEEGSFTPSLSFVGGSTGITHTLQYGSYRKIGDMVFVMGRIALSNKGSDTGQVRINLPYGVSATSGENGGAALVYGKNFTSVTSDNLAINGIGNTATASMFPATTGSSLTDANILNNTDFTFNFSYIAS